jgi:hypothetical protein
MDGICVRAGPAQEDEKRNLGDRYSSGFLVTQSGNRDADVLIIHGMHDVDKAARPQSNVTRLAILRRINELVVGALRK